MYNTLRLATCALNTLFENFDGGLQDKSRDFKANGAFPKQKERSLPLLRPDKGRETLKNFADILSTEQLDQICCRYRFEEKFCWRSNFSANTIYNETNRLTFTEKTKKNSVPQYVKELGKAK